MAAIGSETVDIMRGSPAFGGLREDTATWRVPGFDGIGIKNRGLSHGAFSLVVIKFGSKGTVSSWLSALLQLQGSVVSITDAHGDAYSDCYITSVDQASDSLRAEIGNGGYMGRLTVNGTRT